jgi:predicted type IV restriction endonuclease
MATEKSSITHKHFRLDANKLKRAQKVLQAKSETETVERALDLAISEHERNKLTAEANQKFVKSRVVIRDVFEALAE